MQPCTAADINLTGDSDQAKYKFYPPAMDSAKDINNHFKSLMCLQDDPVLQGDYNSATGKTLQLSFKRCENDPKCEDKDTIDEWLVRKFLVILENQHSFNKQTVEEEIVSKSSRVRWFVLSPQLRQELVNHVDIIRLELTDRILSTGIEKMKE